MRSQRRYWRNAATTRYPKNEDWRNVPERCHKLSGSVALRTARVSTPALSDRQGTEFWHRQNINTLSHAEGFVPAKPPFDARWSVSIAGQRFRSRAAEAS